MATNLREFIESNPSSYFLLYKYYQDYLIVEGITAHKLRSKYKELLSDLYMFDSSFSNEGERLKVYYDLIIVPAPIDEFGNEVDITSNLINIQEGWEILLFSGKHGNFLYDRTNFPFSIELLDNFSEWLLDNYMNYSFLSCIRSHSEVTNQWITILLGVSKDSEEWQGLLSDFDITLVRNIVKVDQDRFGNILYSNGTLDLKPRYFAVCKYSDNRLELSYFIKDSLAYSNNIFYELLSKWIFRNQRKYNFLSCLIDKDNIIYVVVSSVLPVSPEFKNLLIDFYEDVLRVR